MVKNGKHKEKKK
jgi:hypothetical protein